MSLILLVLCLFLNNINTDINYRFLPDWEAKNKEFCGTGVALADINGDGWDDLIIANGNDMLVQTITIYYNNGNGSFPDYPSWESDDSNYHGHISVGDINGDGWIDLAASVFLGENRFDSPGWVKIYYNQQGELSKYPDWRSSETFFNFSCILGDVNQDGKLDLVTACGEGYYHASQKHYNRIFLNNGSGLNTTSSWQDINGDNSMDVFFVDIDKDGDLDLFVANEKASDKIYFNNNGTLNTSPDWQSTESNRAANSVFCADFNRDGYIDVAVSDNKQTTQGGYFKLYLNTNGSLSRDVHWKNNIIDYGSSIALVDANGDDYLDYFAGSWWGEVKIFLKEGNSFHINPDFESLTSSVIEAYYFGDVNKDGLRDTTEVFVLPNSTFRALYLRNNFWHRINSLKRNGIDFKSYCSMPDQGWVSLGGSIAAGDTIEINYTYSSRLDFVVSNWDYASNSPGDYLFLFYGSSNFKDEFSKNKIPYRISFNIFPNPADYWVSMKFNVQEGNIKVYDISGRMINEWNINKEKQIFWNLTDKKGIVISKGLYFVVLNTDEKTVVRKFVKN
ncbi:MAG: T9SS type A sorting domain-containing protein [Candidatus Coatesbacteria bacterium]|nr:T9SS type A sorting domain-containing protein [Candidatus Coatesbacteria bacterium]